jgi:hypothetical protein
MDAALNSLAGHPSRRGSRPVLIETRHLGGTTVRSKDERACESPSDRESRAAAPFQVPPYFKIFWVAIVH